MYRLPLGGDQAVEGRQAFQLVFGQLLAVRLGEDLHDAAVLAVEPGGLLCHLLLEDLLVRAAPHLLFVDHVARAGDEEPVVGQDHGLGHDVGFLVDPVVVQGAQLLLGLLGELFPVHRVGCQRVVGGVPALDPRAFELGNADFAGRFLVGAVEPVFADRGVAHQLRIPGVAVGVLLVDTQDPAARDSLGRQLEFRPAFAGRPAVDPVGSLVPAVVQERDGREEVDLLVVLRVGTLRPDTHPLAVEGEGLRLHVDVLAVAGEDVGQGHGHVLAHQQVVQMLLGARHLAVHDVFGNEFARLGLQDHHPQAAVEEHGAAGHAVELVVLDQHAAGKRPDRLDLAVGHQLAVVGSGPEFPGELPVRGAERVDVAVGAAEEGKAPVDGRRRIDSPAGDEVPDFLARGGVQGVDGVRVDRAQEELPAGDDRLTELCPEVLLPRLLDLGGDVRPGVPAAGVVVTEGRPVGSDSEYSRSASNFGF